MSERRCDKCHYFAAGRKHDGNPGGRCRIRSVAKWPERDADDWCGEFKAGEASGVARDPPTGEAIPGTIVSHYTNYTAIAVKFDTKQTGDRVPREGQRVEVRVVEEPSDEN